MKRIFLIVTILTTILLYGCSSSDPIVVDDFAKCLTENGAEIYGSKDCPHCQTQKAMFGESIKFINYIECTINQQKCAEEEIKYLPTWKFEDGTVTTGVKSFDYLADKTGCVLE
jgi:hypothetical protein